jgi:cytochrome P450
LFAYLKARADEFRENPDEGLVSHLVHSELDGAPLDDDTLLSLLFSVVAGGVDTVTETMSYWMRYLARNPDKRDELVDDPTAIGDAVEELLRRFSVVWVIRTAKQDFEFKGVQFKSNDQFILLLSLLGLDETKNPNPLEVDLHRDRSFHAAFALGAHRCVGSHLARMELRLFLEEWLSRIPEFSITEGTESQTGAGMMISFVRQLSLSWPTS